MNNLRAYNKTYGFKSRALTLTLNPTNHALPLKPAALALLLLGALFCTCAGAAPKGFDAPSELHASPQGFNQNLYLNTVKGIRDCAEDGDYVLITGKISIHEDGTVYLKDREGTEIKVIPRKTIEVEEVYLTDRAQWQMWGQVKKSFFDLHLDLISFSCEI